MVIFTDVHRLFLQGCISQRLLTEANAKDIYRRACRADSVEPIGDGFDEFVADVNQGLNSVDLELRKSLDEANGQPVWALVNTKGDENAQLATEYTATELQYFKKLIEEIVMADDEAYSVTAIKALRIATSLKTPSKTPMFTKNQGETLLDRFVKDKWLVRSREGVFSMSMRTILELQSYLKEEFEENIRECTLCMDIVTKGQRCNIQKCEVRLHDHCATRYFENRGEHVCPTCTSTWRANNVIGVKSMTSTTAKRELRRDRRVDIEEQAQGNQNEDGMVEHPANFERMNTPMQQNEEDEEDEPLVRASARRDKGNVAGSNSGVGLSRKRRK